MDRIQMVRGFFTDRLLYSLKGKLILSFLAISIIPLAVAVTLAFSQFQDALRSQASRQLTVVRDLKINQVETYLHQIKQDIKLVAGLAYVKTAIQQLEIGVHGQSLPQVRQLGFLGRPELSYLEEYSPYAVYHAKYHAFFRELVQTKGYVDVWLVSPEGEIIYTFAKRDDFATDLFKGPARNTPSAQLLRNIFAHAGIGEVQQTDYVSYPPAGDIPVSFFAAPIYDEGKIVGGLVYELSLDQINELMQVHTVSWETGETYLVGADHLLRTKPRFSEQINFFEQKVNTPATQKGALDERGVAIIENYRGIPVLSAYRVLEVNRFKWILLAEVEIKEAFGPANRLRNVLVFIIFVTTLTVIGIGFSIGRDIADPIAELAETSAQIASGNLELRAGSGSRDEIGRLAEAFNTMTGRLSEVIGSLEQQIAERKQAEQALRHSEERYRGLFENSPISLWEEDFSEVKKYLDGLRKSGITNLRAYFENNAKAVTHCLKLVKVTDINKATIDLLGAGDKGDLLTGLEHTFTEDSLAVFREEMIMLAEGSSRFESETVLRGLTGEEKHVALQLIVAPGYEDSLGKVLVSLLDITERRLADEALKKHREHLEELVKAATAELTVAKEQAEAANASKSDFLARMSHEIRTPLNAVTGLTDILLKSELTVEQRDYLNKVKIASNNLLEVINDILDFSRVEAGRLELVHAAFDLDQVLEQLADLFSYRTAQKDLELIFYVAPQVPRHLAGDAGRLTQVLTNLIENAVKFTDEGEIVLRVESADAADQRSGQTTLKFSVSDTGVGISANEMPTLFEPFTQVGRYLTRKHEGAGLGLAICRRLVELMGGRIWAESTPGRGSNFFFTVMLEVVKEQKLRPNLPVYLHGLKTLVVDDMAASRQTLVDVLESFAFKVSAVDSGQKAIEALHRAAFDEPYQLVLLDWKMPGMDGIETAATIRKDPNLHRPPIIILVTAHGRELVQARIETSPVDILLLKPVKPSQLFNAIVELFNQKPSLEPESKPQKAAYQKRFAGRRVLVVEDSELNQQVVVALLEEADLAVETAENGQIAVDKVTGSPRGYYDAVLMDIQMPVMDGYESTRIIREFEKKRTDAARGREPGSEGVEHKIPVIALTAHALTGEKEKCLAAGMDDYLAKPINEKQLHQVLLKWIKPRGEDGDAVNAKVRFIENFP